MTQPDIQEIGKITQKLSSVKRMSERGIVKKHIYKAKVCEIAS